MYITERHLQGVSLKNNPFIFYLCQIVDNFYKNYPVYTLEDVLSSTIKNFRTYIKYSLQTTI